MSAFHVTTLSWALACARPLVLPVTQADTSRPPIPDGFNMPSGPLLTVSHPEDSSQVYLRNVVGIVFEDSTSGTRLRMVLARFSAKIIGGSPRFKEYYVQIPDPGTSYAALDSVVTQLRNEAGVVRAGKTEYQSRVRIRGRPPNGGPEVVRSGPRDKSSRPVPNLPQADTTRPRIPNGFNMPSGPRLTILSPNDPLQTYFRNVVAVIFDDSTDGTTIRSLLARYQATIIGGYPRFKEYVLQVPDPGPAFVALDSLVTQLAAEPGVARARKAEYQSRVRIRGRPPNGGPEAVRSDPRDKSSRSGTTPNAWRCQ